MSPEQPAWHEIAGGIHAWIHPRGSWGESNAGLVLGAGEEALLIDTQWDESATTCMLGSAPLPEGAPIGTLVNTHADGDHAWGNAAVEASRIIASDAAAAVFAAEDPQRLARLIGIAVHTRALPILRVPFVGQRLTEVQILGRYMAQMAAGWDFGGVRLTPPTDTFSGAMDLEIGGRRLELLEVGPAHAHGDTIVHLPDDGIVFAGDVVFMGVTPIMWAGPLSNWLTALETIEALAPEQVVPGHGPVCAVADLSILRDYLEWAATVGAAQRAAGESPARAAAAALRSRAFTRSPWADWHSPERLIVTLEVLEREAEESPPIETLAERARLMTAMGMLAGRRASGR